MNSAVKRILLLRQSIGFYALYLSGVIIAIISWISAILAVVDSSKILPISIFFIFGISFLILVLSMYLHSEDILKIPLRRLINGESLNEISLKELVITNYKGLYLQGLGEAGEAPKKVVLVSFDWKAPSFVLAKSHLFTINSYLRMKDHKKSIVDEWSDKDLFMKKYRTVKEGNEARTRFEDEIYDLTLKIWALEKEIVKMLIAAGNRPEHHQLL